MIRRLVVVVAFTAGVGAGYAVPLAGCVPCCQGTGPPASGVFQVLDASIDDAVGGTLEVTRSGYADAKLVLRYQHRGRAVQVTWISYTY
jgi:hypothetical protein